MDNLNKHQIVLLTLLIAFVTSIATGITVVSLMGQTNQPVTQTINRVVEKTIEKVVPFDMGNLNTDTKEKTTTVVKDEDLTLGAIEKNEKSMVTILGPVADKPEAFISDGIVVSDKGFIISDKLSIVQTNSYIGVFADGSKASLEIVAHNDLLGLTLFKTKLAQNQNIKFNPINFTDSSNVKLGQTVISLSSDGKKVVNIGNVTSIDSKDSKNVSILVNSEITNSIPGSMLFNLSGDIVGMHTTSEKQVFMASNIIKDAVNALLPK